MGSAGLRVATIVLVALAACCTGVASVGAAPRPIVVTIKPACASTINCESFSFSLKNGSQEALNGLTIQIGAPNTVTAFSIGGQPAARPTGVQNAWAIYPATIPVGATVNGNGTVSSPLGPSDVFTIFTTADAFNTATSQDVPLGTAAVAGHAAIDPASLTFSYSPQWGGFLTGHGKTAIRGGYRFLYDPPFYNIYLNHHEPVGAIKESFGGSLTGSGTVGIAIEQVKSASRCGWLIDAKGDFRPGSCAAPVFLPAQLTGQRWTYTLQRPLPPGKYIVESRATSGGTSETGFSAAQHNLLKLDIALNHK